MLLLNVNDLSGDGSDEMPIRVTFISHAAIARSQDIVFPSDEPIDSSALAKVPAIAKNLDPYNHFYCAPELRTRQTAEAFRNGATVLEALRDCDFGHWRGCSLGDIGRNDPEGASAWISDPSAAPHGGESISELLQRAGVWLDSVTNTGHTVAITHPSFIRAAIVHCLGAPPRAFWQIDIVPLSITDLRFNANRSTLRAVGLTIMPS